MKRSLCSNFYVHFSSLRCGTLTTMRGSNTTVVTTETRTREEFTPSVCNGSDKRRVINGTGASISGKTPGYKPEIVWRNVIIFVYVHVCAVYAVYLGFTKTKGATLLFGYLVASCGGFGITAGAHRLWAHKSYKATWQLRVILAIFQTIAFQNHIYEWSRDHRVHHKFSETDADPHNAKRGFFFSHVGWLLMKKHPDVINKGRKVDMSDLEEDPVVVFQRKYYLILMPLLTFVLPTIVPIYLWNEDPWVSWYTCLLRWVLGLNFTWLVNSAAHMWGNKPYDRNISPAENPLVAFLAYGEGWHNYHHVFPYDYKTSELVFTINAATIFINFFALFGWAYDLKTISKETIMKRVGRTGDGSHKAYENNNITQIINDLHSESKENVWGWGDEDMKEEDYKCVEIVDKTGHGKLSKN
ncbi:acyl-CoA Delta-9 desaturase-like isoform X4 [Periplaneta americana]|uniref:acyl-CoA Delta-9 desaturase-like isoform X4 n=1 Tax=Periplaneta americana TaxID=6978 RepID=UPI0037E85F5C